MLAGVWNTPSVGSTLRSRVGTGQLLPCRSVDLGETPSTGQKAHGRLPLLLLLHLLLLMQIMLLLLVVHVTKHMALHLLRRHRHQQHIKLCGQQHLLPLLEDSGRVLINGRATPSTASVPTPSAAPAAQSGCPFPARLPLLPATE